MLNIAEKVVDKGIERIYNRTYLYKWKRCLNCAHDSFERENNPSAIPDIHGPNEDESCWEFKLSLSFGLKLSYALVGDFEPAHFS